MKNYLPFFIIVVFLLTLGIVGLVFFSSDNKQTSLLREDTVNRSLNLGQQNNQPKETFDSQRSLPTEEFKILYQDSNDTEGRTVIYQLLPDESLYGGSGIVYTKDGKRIRYMVGLFKGWQDIDGTKDKYLKLYDPLNNKNLPLVRVAFEPSAIFNNTVDMTALAVENINEAKQLPRDASRSSGKQLVVFSSKLDKFLKINDAIMVSFVTNDVSEPVKDVNDNLLALWFTIRRNNGLADFQKEIK